MREIKFRAWDKRYKKMVQDFILTSEGEMVVRQSKSLFDFSYDKKHWVLMQYTGLKDENVKEIYEGDICRIEYFRRGGGVFMDEYVGEVKFFHGGFHIGENPITKVCDNNESDKLPMFIEVIGNIYQNFDLIK